MEQYLKNFKNCLQKEIPFCSSACPFHIDIPDFIEKAKRGSFKAAFKTYRNATGFPAIASFLCPEPCKGVCPRRETDRAIELGMLERACLDLAGDTIPTDYNLPSKKKRVAIIGAGISGLASALRLSTKKYEVEIFEKSDRIGGSLWNLMPEEIFLADIERQFAHQEYILHLNREILSPKDLEGGGFHAVYVSTGKGGNDFDLLGAVAESGDKYCLKNEGIGWFAGGGLIGDEPIYALANGLFMGTVLDNFLKTGNLYYPENKQDTCMRLDPARRAFAEPVLPADGKAYTAEEAEKEASRCMECQCDSCRIYCDLTEFYNKWPLRIRDEVMATTIPGSSEVKATPAKRLLSTCSQCGLCKDVCPQDIDLGGLILEGRKSMHKQKKAPWVFHDFWLRDMDFADGNEAALSRLPKGHSSCEYAFFPGCQLGASDPDLVVKTYRALLQKKEDMGLILQCCGVPAEWAGMEERHQEVLDCICRQWEMLGKPTMILACPTCEKKFKTYLPQILTKSLYEVLDEWEIKGGVSENMTAGRTYSVFDPCAARDEQEVKKAVRRLSEGAGCHLEPLPENDAHGRCCSYGGQGAIANPEYASFVTKKRIEESENPYIAYCINCRDIFLADGKETVHILDILFNQGKTPEKLPTVTERRQNRIRLKELLLAEFWEEKMELEKKEYDVNIQISEQLKEKLNRERILEEDIISIIDFCERTDRKSIDREKGTFTGYREIGFMTCWVEYKNTNEEKTFELVNAYTHRMKLELEAVWNGRKTDLDLQ